MRSRTNASSLLLSGLTCRIETGVSVIQFVRYRNFVLQAYEVKRSMLDPNDILVLCKASEHALRVLVEKHV